MHIKKYLQINKKESANKDLLALLAFLRLFHFLRSFLASPTQGTMDIQADCPRAQDSDKSPFIKSTVTPSDS